jgi:hypothetical protein
MELHCDYCKQPFESKRNDALYCSASCRQLAYVLRKAHGNQELIYKSVQAKERIQLLELPLGKKEEENHLSTQLHAEPLTDKFPSGTKEQDNDLPTQISHEGETTVNTENEAPAAYESGFLKELRQLIEERDHVEILNELEVNMDLATEWVGLRYRCLVESLLNLSDMKYLNLDDLKEVCNAFTALLDSNAFNMLPDDYPYLNDIMRLQAMLCDFCINTEGDQPKITFQLKRDTRLKLLATRWELANFVPKLRFSDLDFEE